MSALLAFAVLAVLLALAVWALLRSRRTVGEQRARIRELLVERAGDQAALADLQVYLQTSAGRQEELHHEENTILAAPAGSLPDRANVLFRLPDSSPSVPPGPAGSGPGPAPGPAADAAGPL